MFFHLSTIQIILLLLLSLVVVFLVVFWYYLRLHIYHSKYVIKRVKSWVFLELQMPKDAAGEENKPQSSEEKKNLIAVAEQLYATLADIGQKGNWFHPGDYFSFEIACIDKKISFYINCPRHLQDIIEKQMQAQYPTSYIEEVKGYNPFIKGGEVAGAELELTKKSVYPFKTYKTLETDPLNALTNAMSKLEEGESAVIQYILCPAGTTWQDKPRKMALEIQQGKTPEYVEKSGLQKFLSGFGKEVKKSILKQEEPNQSHQNKDLSGEKAPINLTPQQQEIVKKLEEKASRAGYRTNVRIIASSKLPNHANLQIQNLQAAFMQYNMPPFNGFKIKKRKKSEIYRDFIFRIYRNFGGNNILNTEELASIWHPPTPFLETPNIKWLTAKKAAPPVNLPEEGILLGTNEYRGVKTPIKFAELDRLRHMYILGRSGGGKSYFMGQMAVQDIKRGAGIAVLDPHGDMINDILARIPKERAEDVILFEPFDLERPFGLNMLEVDREEQKDFAVQEMISIFYKLVTDPAMLGPMFEHNMRNAMLTLMADEEHPGTLVEIPRIFTDTDFQKYKVSKVKDPVVRAFWEKEMAKTSDFHKSEMLGYLVSKVGRFVENSMMRNIVGQPHSSFNFRKVMDEKKILLVNLSKGLVGEINAKLLGLILVSKLQMAALSRADIPSEEKRVPFFLYVDEFQNFITDAFASILSEARKYRLSLVIAHQYLAQLQGLAGVNGAGSSDLRDAVFGNAGTVVTFRCGVEDAEFLAKEFSPTFNQYDLVNIEARNMYIKLMVNGTASKPFNMLGNTMPTIDSNAEEIAKAIRQLSRLKYGRQRNLVESEILEASQVADMMAAGSATIEKGL